MAETVRKIDMNKFFIFIIVFTGILHAHDILPTKLEELASLRKLQRIVTTDQAHEIDVAIQDIKQELQIPHTPIVCAWYKRVSLLYWQIGLLLLWYVALYYIFWRKSFPIGIAVVCLLIFFGTNMIALWKENVQQSVIITHETAVYLGPGDTYPCIGIVAYLKEFPLLKTTEKWYYIHSSEIKGWIQKNDAICI